MGCRVLRNTEDMHSKSLQSVPGGIATQRTVLTHEMGHFVESPSTVHSNSNFLIDCHVTAISIV